METEWRKIPGLDGYSASSLGHIYSDKKNKLMSQHLNHGYKIVGLSVNGKSKNFRVHRLVAMAFYGLPNDGQVVNHKNGVRADNRVENIEWSSISQNTKHAIHELKTFAPPRKFDDMKVLAFATSMIKFSTKEVRKELGMTYENFWQYKKSKSTLGEILKEHSKEFKNPRLCRRKL